MKKIWFLMGLGISIIQAQDRTPAITLIPHGVQKIIGDIKNPKLKELITLAQARCSDYSVCLTTYQRLYRYYKTGLFAKLPREERAAFYIAFANFIKRNLKPSLDRGLTKVRFQLRDVSQRIIALRAEKSDLKSLLKDPAKNGSRDILINQLSQNEQLSDAAQREKVRLEGEESKIITTFDASKERYFNLMEALSSISYKQPKFPRSAVVFAHANLAIDAYNHNDSPNFIKSEMESALRSITEDQVEAETDLLVKVFEAAENILGAQALKSWPIYEQFEEQSAMHEKNTKNTQDNTMKMRRHTL